MDKKLAFVHNLVSCNLALSSQVLLFPVTAGYLSPWGQCFWEAVLSFFTEIFHNGNESWGLDLEQPMKGNFILEKAESAIQQVPGQGKVLGLPPVKPPVKQLRPQSFGVFVTRGDWGPL